MGDVITIAYDLVKEIKGAYDSVQENKELLEGLVVYTDVINFSLDQIQRKKHEFVDTSVIEEALQKCTIALENAKHIILDRGKKKKKLKMFRDMREANKIKNEIEGAKVNLNHSMLLINNSLGIISAIRQDAKHLVTPDNNDWRIDSGDVSVKVHPDGNFEEILGYGSFSTVVKGVYKVNKKEISVAVKVPRNANEIQDCEELIKVFKRELRIFYSINHKNIVKFYGGIERNMNDLPSYRIVTEILEIDLERFIKENHDSLDREDRMSILEGVIDGLSYLHCVKIIHRDIKPKNIMLDENGTPKIIDFGLAKELEDRARTTTKLCGTPAYAAPERKNNEPSSEGTDIYSFGLVGSFVFEAKDPPEDNHDEVRRYFHEKKCVDLRFEYIGQCLDKEVSKRISSYKLSMLMTEFRAKAEYKPPNTNPLLNNQNLNSDAKPDSGSPNTSANVNKINLDAFSKYFAEDDFFKFVEQGNVDEASKLFADNKQVLDKNARNANGLTVIEVAMKGSHWDMVEWLLDSGFVCEGVGKEVYGNGRYVGGLKDGKRNGRGTATYADGSVYDGEYRDDNKHGRGRYTWADGDVYDGEYRDDNRNGRGRYTFADGTIKEGRWENGTFLG